MQGLPSIERKVARQMAAHPLVGAATCNDYLQKHEHKERLQQRFFPFWQRPKFHMSEDSNNYGVQNKTVKTKQQTNFDGFYLNLSDHTMFMLCT